MITIQGFATLCGCNTQTLRYYDRIGLLTPAKVDGWTGYRYYEEDQAMLFVKIKDLQQAGFTIEEIRILLKEDDDHILAAFDRKIEKQAQKLAQIREIQRSYLKDRMEMQNMVSMMISYVDDHLKKPGLWKEFGLDMNKETELVAKAHAMLADWLAGNRDVLDTVTLTTDDRQISGASNVVQVMQEGAANSADRLLINRDGSEEENDIPKDAEVVFRRDGWTHISEWIRDMPVIPEEAERYCLFELTADSAANDPGLPVMMLLIITSKLDELKGGVVCKTIPGTDGRNHFTLLKK
ncbi:MAG: hypothetical protein CW338_05005 [Clostridiales bacterium]|nr:hypothetical protein [Clostridiales bacterium]